MLVIWSIYLHTELAYRKMRAFIHLITSYLFFSAWFFGFIVVLLVLLFLSLTKQVGGWFWPWKTSLTPPQVVCAGPKSGTVLVIDVSLFHYCYYFIWYNAVAVWIWIWLLLFRAILGSRPGVHCTCWRPGFDLQVLKFIHIHGYSSISPDPLYFLIFHLVYIGGTGITLNKTIIVKRLTLSYREDVRSSNYKYRLKFLENLLILHRNNDCYININMRQP